MRHILNRRVGWRCGPDVFLGVNGNRTIGVRRRKEKKRFTMKYENTNETIANVNGIELKDKTLEEVAGGFPRAPYTHPKGAEVEAIYLSK